MGVRRSADNRILTRKHRRTEQPECRIWVEDARKISSHALWSLHLQIVDLEKLKIRERKIRDRHISDLPT